MKQWKNLTFKGIFVVDIVRYLYINLPKEDGGDTNYPVHRLVAYAFLRKDELADEVDHIDGNPANNRVENLRWVTHIENMNNPISRTRHTTHIIKQLKVCCIELNRIFNSARQVSEEFSVDVSSIRRSCRCGTGVILYKKSANKKLYHFKYLADTHSSALEQQPFKASKNNSRKVRCIEDGKVYTSLANASRAYGISVTAIAKSCKFTADNASKKKQYGMRSIKHFEWA